MLYSVPIFFAGKQAYEKARGDVRIEEDKEANAATPMLENPAKT